MTHQYTSTTLALLLGGLAMLWHHAVDAQPLEGASNEAPAVINLRGFIDTYYAYDLSDPQDNLRPGFFYNHNRHNELSINLALLELSYEGERTRARLGLMVGTYPEYNYAAELPLLRSVFESWVGVKLSEHIEWDAGVFPSHIGFESAISTDNLTLTRSLTAENSPYFLAGTRLYWTPNDTWTLGVILANGWQNIRETPDNDSKGFGTQVTWTPGDQLTLNSSTWVSDELPEGDSRLRLFHDLYAILKPSEQLSLILGVDVGGQQAAAAADDAWDLWWGGALIARWEITEQLATAARLEYFSDPDQVIIALADQEGLQTFGASANVDVRLTELVMLRVEGRMLRADEDIFSLSDDPSPLYVVTTASMAISFDATIGQAQ